MGSNRFVILAAAMLFAASLCQSALAWEAADMVGKPGMMLTSGSGKGSLCEESVLGDACADAMRAAAGTDFALIAGGELRGDLDPKESDFGTIYDLFYDGDSEILVAAVSPAELTALLEYGLSHIVLDETLSIDAEASDFPGFPQIAGFHLTYDATAHAGERVMRLSVDGKRVDPTDDRAEYTLAVSEAMFGAAADYPALPAQGSGITVAEALADFVAAGTPDDYTGKDRIIAAGSSADRLVERYPVVACAVAAGVIWTLTRLWRFKKTGENMSEHLIK